MLAGVGNFEGAEENEAKSMKFIRVATCHCEEVAALTLLLIWAVKLAKCFIVLWK